MSFREFSRRMGHSRVRRVCSLSYAAIDFVRGECRLLPDVPSMPCGRFGLSRPEGRERRRTAQLLPLPSISRGAGAAHCVGSARCCALQSPRADRRLSRSSSPWRTSSIADSSTAAPTATVQPSSENFSGNPTRSWSKQVRFSAVSRSQLDPTLFGVLRFGRCKGTVALEAYPVLQPEAGRAVLIHRRGCKP